MGDVVAVGADHWKYDRSPLQALQDSILACAADGWDAVIIVGMKNGKHGSCYPNTSSSPMRYHEYLGILSAAMVESHPGLELPEDLDWEPEDDS